MFDPILVANRLPKLAERAMRDAILARLGRHHLEDEALLRFEALVQRLARDGIRPASLFAERDRIVREISRFAQSRLASRLFAIKRRGVAALGRDARPFDAVVHGRCGGLYGVVFRRLPGDGRRLESMRAIRSAAAAYAPNRLRGVLVYDFGSGTVRTLRCGVRPVELSAA
ncbi:MAG: hypothetical protein JO192_04335 [Candidatus Eremiobacteraeota bacterium]|nr:hypothetical protein [Candidatus Eremiobacteraeota bacterium]MBV8721432.1 hypothetical protein [Candidatus Eremiobacteraeota bacterium]